MHQCWLAIWIALFTELTATAGSIETLDGRRLTGDVTLSGNALLVVDGSATNQVTLTDLLSADFTPDRPDTASLGTGTGLLGAYFPGVRSDSAPLVRLDEGIDFNWGAGEALPGFLPEAFTAIWAGEIEPPIDGEYQLHLSADGAAALTLDGKPAIQINSASEVIERSSAIRKLQAGRRVPLTLSYTNASGPARVRLAWSSRAISQQTIPRDRLHPVSPLPGHATAITNRNGLLGTYYNNATFSGAGLSRVDESVNFAWQNVDPLSGYSRTNLSIRWTGRVRAEHTEEYAFYVTTDERVQLWVDDKPVIHRTEQFWLSDSKGTVPLVAGENHAIRLEISSTSGDVVARLGWSSASTPRTNIPSLNLSPQWTAAGSMTGRVAAGVLLRNGSFVACTVDRATETSLRASGLLKTANVTIPNVARINLGPIPAALEKTIPQGRSGVLLARGDFVDGDFRGLDGQRVRLNSILFGSRTYEARKEALAVVLRSAVTNTTGYQLQLRDRSVLHTATLRIENGHWIGRDTIAGPLKLPAADVARLQRLSGSR